MKILQQLFWAFLLAGIVIVVSVLIVFGMINNDADQSTFIELQPTEISIPDKNTRFFSFTLEEISVDKSYLVFMANHEEVTAMVAGKTFEDRKESTIFGHTTGTIFHFIAIPNGARRITVKCENVYSGVSQSDYRFYYGDGLHIMKYLLRNSLLAAFFSLLDICLGVAMIIYWFMARTKINKKKALLNLGTFTMLMGFWTLNETNLWKLYIIDGLAGSLIAFSILMIAPIPYTLFVNELFDVKKKQFVLSIVIASFINYVVCTLLQAFNIADFKQTVMSTHILIALCIVYQIYALYYGYRHRGFDYKVKLNLIGTAFLAGVVVFDLMKYYQDSLLMNEAGRVSLLIYTFTLGLAAVKETNDALDENRKAEAYKELAFIDALTGLNNRNAYHDYLNKNKAREHNMIISYDLNNLKVCNDTMGHKIGDIYIRDAAMIIKNVFGEYGKCYRIGGDEFCTIITDDRRIPIKEYLEKLKEEQKKYKKEHQVEYMKIAAGYAIYDPEKDRNLEDIRNRSDEMMYLSKSKMKKSSK